MPKKTAQEIRRRIGLVQNLATMKGETRSLLNPHRVFLPLIFGHFPESAVAFHDWAESTLSSRENGYWVWRPQDQEHRGLGIPGSHTLGQAAFPSLTTVRAGLCIGDRVLLAKALEAMRQMELYEIPRGASMWECPQFQPDLLAAALAIRAYGEAYEGTGDPKFLEHARYWAWTGLPFVYLWQMDGIPTMLYNTVGVMGSTFFTHSWFGRPVVWMGLDYAYALLDLAKWDSSFPWLTVAQGITRSAMAQQLVQGDEQGLYPDSWEMATNKPNPVFLAPLLIQLNEFKLRGVSLGPHHRRTVGEDGDVFLTAAAEISSLSGSVPEGRIHFELISAQRISPTASLGPVSRPKRVRGAGKEVQDSQALDSADRGWMYCEDLKVLIAKCGPEGDRKRIKVMWK
jgi:hypothetical protein